MIRYDMGDSCIVWSLGKEMGTVTSRRVLQTYRTLKNKMAGEPGFKDLVPSYTDLALYFDPMNTDLDHLVRIVEGEIREPLDGVDSQGKTVQFNVVYSGDDLGRVAQLTGLTIRQVIQHHTSATYTVAMIGFLPHFPYLNGLDPILATPRLERPRKKVPAGAVAIGGAQAGIYPAESPGGWNIIGMTDIEPLKTLEPGDRVMFQEVETL